MKATFLFLSLLSVVLADNIRSLPECLTTRQIWSNNGDFPADVCSIDSSRHLLLYKNGRINLLRRTGEQWSSTQVLDMNTQGMLNLGELGLLSCVTSPNVLSNGHVYLEYKARPSTAQLSLAGRSTIGLHTIARYTFNLQANTIDTSTQSIIFGACRSAEDCAPTTREFHSGGGLSWGNDGSLLFGIGDSKIFEGSESDRYWQSAAGGFVNWPQSLSDYRGKIIRIDVNGNGPSDNPFYEAGRPKSCRSRVFANGMRNPWSTLTVPRNSSWQNVATLPSTNAAAGTKMLVFDVGFVSREAIKLAAAGTNGGWPAKEGTFTVGRAVDMSRGQAGNAWSPSSVVSEYSGPGACVVGGVILEARDKWPASLVDSVVFGDFVRGQLYSAKSPTSGPISPQVFALGASNVIKLKRSTSGTILVIQRDGSTMYVREVLPDPAKANLPQCQPVGGSIQTTKVTTSTKAPTSTKSSTKAVVTSQVPSACVNAAVSPALPTRLPTGLEVVTTVTDSGLYTCLDTTGVFPYNTCALKLNVRGAPMTSRGGIRHTQGVGVGIAVNRTQAATARIQLDNQCWGLTGSVFVDVRSSNSTQILDAIVRGDGRVLWNSTVVNRANWIGSSRNSLALNLTGLQGVKQLLLTVTSRTPVSGPVLVNWAALHLSCGASAPYLPRMTLSSQQAPAIAQKVNSRVNVTIRAKTWQGVDINTFSWGANLAHCNGALCHYHYDMAVGTGQNFNFPLLPHDDACLFWEGTVWATDSCGRRNRASIVYKVAEAEQFCVTTQLL
jgi:hypothetical protein